METFKLERVSFQYPNAKKLALDSIDLSIFDGEFIVICGESGCGKTTLLKQFKKELTPTGKMSGNIFYDGELIEKIQVQKSACDVGFVSQDVDNQIVCDKVFAELSFGLENLGVDSQTIRQRVAEMCNFFSIGHWFYKETCKLSGGQKQLLNLASVMALQPRVLILDEPTAMLDPISAMNFIQTLKRINDELGVTIILCEHRLEQVLPICTRVLVMEHGKIIASNTPKKIGNVLLGKKMFESLPAVMKIYAGVEKQPLDFPITIHEARDWLSSKLLDVHITQHSVETQNRLHDKVCVELKDVWYKYGKNSEYVLKGLTVKIMSGEIYSILGGNGSGKSTMLSLICGLYKPFSGKVLVNGKSVLLHKNLFCNNLAMLPQNPQTLFVKTTVLKDMKEVSSDENKIRDLGRMLEIEDLFDSHPYDLSGGQMQRAALLKTLLLEPKILLLDEPTKGLDSFFKIKLADILNKLKESGMTIIMVSHDVEFCAMFTDYCGMIFAGGVVCEGPPNQFFAGNSFYTTSGSKMSRKFFKNGITYKDVILLCKNNLQNNQDLQKEI